MSTATLSPTVPAAAPEPVQAPQEAHIQRVLLGIDQVKRHFGCNLSLITRRHTTKSHMLWAAYLSEEGAS